MDRHIVHHRVLEALAEKGCSLCRLVKENTDRFFDSLSYELANDVEFRRKFNSDFGFCKRHTEEFINKSDVLSSAVVYRGLLEYAVSEMESNVRRIKRMVARENRCEVCRIERESAKRYAVALAEMIYKDDFKQKFLNSDGLCLFHFSLVVKQLWSPPRWFVEFHLNRYKELISKLDEFVAGENVESFSVNKVVEQITGRF